MGIELVPGGLGNAIGSAAVVLVGILVAFAKPRSKPQLWFVAYALTFGISSGLSNMNLEPAWLHDAWWTIVWLAGVAWAVSSAGFVLSYAGKPERRSSWLYAAVPLVLLLGFTLVVQTTHGWNNSFILLTEAFGVRPTFSFMFGWMSMYVSVILTWVGSAILARAALRKDDAGATQLALVAAAMMIFPAAFAGVLAPAVGHLPGVGGLVLASLLGAVWSSAAWLWVAHKGIAPRAARNVALIPLVIGLIALVMGLEGAAWFGGAARALMSAILAYAVLRHQAFGIDAKLRFGISKSTMAAVFVAVFFVVSEAAQAFFGAETGNEYYGIAAAGVLVLGIAPLQRFADRVAEKAVPRQLQGDTAEEQYRTALRIALANGSINRTEEKLLAELADRLGLSVTDVMDMRAQEMGSA